ncbi:DUF1399 domain-containing protein [Flavobacterium sp. SUN046]|uniref:glycine-rich domain-containing protein n=1 Tax=Flavobacterium sp. SUN046 TaxID=3002440 RepID=UPI002DBEE29A|nr:DUF1399 domain-containing protein [Flavobacterium sp. SUN046]MEC4048904.1 DUF1399 domain-containing protein [Flavobacterium sp. SUN046]
MNKELWDKILKFEFDNPPSEYGFSIRLANENFWTKEFTELSILEYKKFMFLAATSESMVSPSEIVDTVWHQHLIFTQSYHDFCNLINKQIQHIPSTHNKEEFDKFRRAKERTKILYTDIFGEQPNAIWEYNNMFESLNLEKSKFKIRTFLIIGILTFILLTVPSYFLLKPIYIKIHNPFFVIGYITLCLATFIGLEIYNRNKLKKIVNSFDKNSFIFQLHPFEVVYLKTQKIENVINGTVNELIDNKTIVINTDDSMKLSDLKEIKSKEQQQTVTVLDEFEKIFYHTLIKHLANKPIFWNTSNSLDAFQKYFNKSKEFGFLFYTNFAVLSILLMLGFIRFTSGVLREKPVLQILIISIILIIIIIAYLNRFTKLISTKTIPNLYRTEILTKEQIENNWQWNYFLFGSSVLSTAFIPLVNYIDRNNSINNTCGSSCANSCGSSCGSSCGGCGGN